MCERVIKSIGVACVAIGAAMLALRVASAQDVRPKEVRGELSVADFPKDAVDLMINGSFDEPNAAQDGPAHWQDVDNFVCHWVDAPATDAAEGAKTRGKVIKIDTDVKQGQAYTWWCERYLRGAPLDKAPARQPTVEPKYDTIAGLDGGFFWSDFIEIKEGGAYRVYLDAKGPGAKVFIRGYEKKPAISFGDEAPAVQELFRNARGEPKLDERGRPIRYRLRYLYTTWFPVGGSDQWQTYTHKMPRHPNGREITENVRWIRIMIYPYWPPATYWFDNVRLIEVEPAPGYGRPDADEADIDEGKVIR